MLHIMPWKYHNKSSENTYIHTQETSLLFKEQAYLITSEETSASHILRWTDPLLYVHQWPIKEKLIILEM